MRLNATLKSRLVGSFGALAVLFGLVAGLNLFLIKNVAEGYEHAARVNGPKLRAMARLRSHLSAALEQSTHGALAGALAEPDVAAGALAARREAYDRGLAGLLAAVDGYEFVATEALEEHWALEIRAYVDALHGLCTQMLDSAAAGSSVAVALRDGPEIERLAARIQALVDAAVDEELVSLETGYRQAQERETAALRLTIVAACSVAGLAMLAGLHAAQSILGPVRHLRDTAGELARGRYGTRVDLTSFPELEALASAFNAMADEIQTSQDALASHVARVTESNTRLEREMTERQRAETEREVLHEQLMAASRDAGMAQLATGVLHNVGNALNSVNVAAARAADIVRTSRINDLRKVATMVGEQPDLAAFVADDPRGHVLPRFLDEIGCHLAREQEDVVRELGELRENVNHIREVISMQQSYAKVTSVAADTDPRALVDDALRMRENALARHGIEIVREHDPDLPPIRTDKHRVLQILLNLISNAERAMESTPREARRLVLRLEPTSIGIRISVIDHGDGIPPENLTRIFTNGFTTRASGHGFGLHMAALAAQELGGSLTAHSDGIGAGATFVLDVPSAATARQETAA